MFNVKESHVKFHTDPFYLGGKKCHFTVLAQARVYSASELDSSKKEGGHSTIKNKNQQVNLKKKKKSCINFIILQKVLWSYIKFPNILYDIMTYIKTNELFVGYVLSRNDDMTYTNGRCSGIHQSLYIAFIDCRFWWSMFNVKKSCVTFHADPPIVVS